jgi:hypothetical protein
MVGEPPESRATHSFSRQKNPFLKKKGPFNLHPILPRLWFKGKRKEKLTR